MESTNRPYVVCHILMALDGKIDGACMSAACAKAYGQLRTTFDCQATIYGTTTMAETYSDGLAPAVLPACETVWPHEDYAAPSDVHNFIVSVDPQGILGWNDKYVEKRGRPKAHVIEVLTEQVSNEYLAYLRKVDVSYVFAGKDRLDCTLLLGKLMNKFKTITALLLTGILTLSLLTACGNSTSSDHADSSTAGPSQIVSSAQGGQQSSPEETSDGLVVTTAGKVQGTLNDGVYTYLGVPYAHATERFVPAQAVEPWEGVFQADTYGNISPQGAMFGMPGQAQPGTDNNCQNLNIWTPGVGDDGARPVMVWLHGGGFSNGSGNDQGYQGGNLSRSGDVVVVTVNHRLNLFGHLDLSAYGEKYERSANVGITDIVAALEWIQDNIAAFGGDPDNVTVFGQSGGGAKVLALMTSPYAQGLFHKGIVQSGATETVGVNFTSQEASTRLTENFLSILNISEDNIETLQTISEDDLQSAGTQALQMTADEFQIPAALG